MEVAILIGSIEELSYGRKASTIHVPEETFYSYTYPGMEIHNGLEGIIKGNDDLFPWNGHGVASLLFTSMKNYIHLCPFLLRDYEVKMKKFLHLLTETQEEESSPFVNVPGKSEEGLGRREKIGAPQCATVRERRRSNGNYHCLGIEMGESEESSGEMEGRRDEIKRSDIPLFEERSSETGVFPSITCSLFQNSAFMGNTEGGKEFPHEGGLARCFMGPYFSTA